MTWCPSRVFPPVRACVFSSRLTSVTFLADPSAGGGLPRGTFIYATSPVPVQVGTAMLTRCLGNGTGFYMNDKSVLPAYEAG